MIKYINENGVNKTLGLFPYIIQKIDTGNIETTTADARVYGVDGSLYRGNSLGGRNIEIELSIVCDNDTELKMFKRDLSALFNPKLTGKLFVGDIYINCVCDGGIIYPTGADNRNTGYQKAIINLKALDPWFYSEDIHALLSTWYESLNFPVELTAEGIEYGTKTSNLIHSIDNKGDEETGFICNIKVAAQSENIFLHHITKGSRLEISGTYEVGDEIRINTNKGAKRVNLYRGGVETNIFNRLTNESEFFSLWVGTNEIRLGAAKGEEGLTLELIYKERFLND